MSTPQFNKGQAVIVVADYNHFSASAGIVYHVAANNKIMGDINVQLLQDGKSVGAISQNKLKAK